MDEDLRDIPLVDLLQGLPHGRSARLADDDLNIRIARPPNDALHQQQV